MKGESYPAFPYMYRFWETIIRPAFEILQPKTIVEIGVDAGLHSQQLLTYCHAHNAVLHGIDPAPQIDIQQWVSNHHPYFVFHHEKSLDALQRIPVADVVLIDGDHNWYTVLHELKILEKQSVRHNRYPVVFFHDVEWPYARRDLYYNPADIPEEFRQPYAQKGMRKDSNKLVETDGLNPTLYNAIQEKNQRNGVRTAIEDFIEQSSCAWQFRLIPGLHGLGILVEKTVLENHIKFASFLQTLEISPPLLQHISQIEEERIVFKISTETQERHRQMVEELAHANNQKKKDVIEQLTVQIVEQQKAIEMLRNEQTIAEQKIQQIHNEVGARQTALEEISATLQQMKQSRSWRWTAPVRIGEKYVRSNIQNLSKFVIRYCSAVWHMSGRPFPSLIRSMKKTLDRLIDATYPQKSLLQKRRNDRDFFYKKMRRITIVIPVFNALKETKNCLESVLLNTDIFHHILIIDDASSDPQIEPYLTMLKEKHRERMTIVRQQKNIGFVQSVNTALRMISNDDVILLNNDTIVPPAWAERLQEAAYSHPRAASVIPLSNQASIYSVLQHSIDQLLQTYSVADIDRHIERHSDMLLPEIPTGVGFCLFMKRTALDTVGLFNEDFGIGYGEENDWCMRARNAGFHHYLHDGCFVYHVGHVSMQAAGHTNGESTIASHETLLQTLHPEYENIVRSFCAKPTMTAIREHIESNHNTCSIAPERIAYILHHPLYSGHTGGVEFHVEDLCAQLGTTHECFVIAPDKEDIIVQYKNSNEEWHTYRYAVQSMLEADRLKILTHIFKRFRFSIIHIHHTEGWSFALLPLAKESGAAVLFTAHDWLFVHKKTHPLCMNDEDVIDHEIVRERGMFLRSVDLILTPSSCVTHIAQSAYGESIQTHTMTWGINSKHINIQPAADHFTICFLSYVHDERKGSAIIRELIPHLVEQKMRVVLLGSDAKYWSEFKNEPLVECKGAYDRSAVVDALQDIAPHIVCILSTSPETYCYALSEAWSAGIPAYVTPIGAPVERIHMTGAGHIAPSFRPEEIAKDLLSFLQSPAYKDAKIQAENLQIPTARDMANNHANIYALLLQKKQQRNVRTL